MIGFKRAFSGQTILFCNSQFFLRLLALALCILGTNFVANAQVTPDYYEPPRVLSQENARFARLLTVGRQLVLVYQVLRTSSVDVSTISIVARLALESGRFGNAQVLVDNIPFAANSVPLVYSLTKQTIGTRERLALAYTNGPLRINVVELLLGSDGSINKSDLGSIRSDLTMVNPRLFLHQDGSAILFLTRIIGNNFNLAASRVASLGAEWTQPQAIDDDLQGNFNLNPSYVRIGNKDVLFFQSFDFRDQDIQNSRFAYNQIFVKTSVDGGITWSNGRFFSDFVEDADRLTGAVARSYDNQRPFVALDKQELVLLWERGRGRSARQIHYVRLDSELKPLGPPEKISEVASGAFNPEWLSKDGSEFVTWFSAPNQGSRVFLSLRSAQGRWSSQQMNGEVREASFASIAVLDNRFHLVFHSRQDRSEDAPFRLVYVEPDRQALPPRLTSLNFIEGGRDNLSSLNVRMQAPADASGIIGYSWIFTMQRDAEVQRKENLNVTSQLPSLLPTKDGEWFLKVRSVDKLGNWSDPSTLSYWLDTTPPLSPRFLPLKLDESGYLASNSFDVSWQSSPDLDLDGYQYSLQYLGLPEFFDPPYFMANNPLFPVMERLKSNDISRVNVENGIYAMALWSYDRVGNVSSPSYLFFRANKFIPRTRLDFVNVAQDLSGQRFLSISGRGFTSNGTIVRVVLDRDALAPWDYEYVLSRAAYQVSSDRILQNLVLDNVKTASYLIGLEHSERGMAFSDRRLAFEERGVIKYGDVDLSNLGRYKISVQAAYSISSGNILMILVALLLLVVISFSSLQLRRVYADAVLMQDTARALISGSISPLWLKKGKVQTMKIQIRGLRIKFTVFFLFLVVTVVAIVALPLSNYIQSNQKMVLAQALEDRLRVMMESVGSSAANFLPDAEQYSIELSRLAEQGKAMQEVSYITISGKGIAEDSGFDNIWGSTDPVLSGESVESTLPVIKRSATIVPFVAGRSTIDDILAKTVIEQQEKFDNDARIKLGTIPSDLRQRRAELSSLANDRSQAGDNERQRIDGIARQLDQSLITTLDQVAGDMKSIPTYNARAYDEAITDYIFYKPIYYRDARDADAQLARYYRGLVRIGVNTTRINQQIATTQNEIIINVIIFAAIALLGGLIGAIVLSTIIVNPIRRLVRGVELVKDIISLDVVTQEKMFDDFLHKDPLRINSKDELKTLANTIISMVGGLKKGAETNKDLIAGKDIQKMFIPLDKVGKGKGTTGKANSEHSEIFGYYEGAKGVSGDYFYYQKISPDVYACIKCDIAGKGIPAALIMVEVATLFLNHFEDWQRKELERKRFRKLSGTTTKDEGALVPLVRTINDLVAEREFEARFAAFNIVLFNEKNGECTFCNAGDNLVHIYRDIDRAVETISLANPPAAGQFSSKVFPITFAEDKNQLHIGDILLMFTDGVEESQRHYRNADFSLSPANEKDVELGLVPEGVRAGSTFEEFGVERIKEIVAAVQSKQRYFLKKHKNPIENEVLEFDFSTLTGSAEDTVLGLVAVEKIFRIIPDPKANEENRILIDKVVDDFLKKYFVQYRNYFRFQRDANKYDLYWEYTHLKEEAQYDDLTLLALRKR